MNLTDLHIDDFGAWHDLRLEGLGPGLNVLYGPNEAGKTTLLNFVRSVLYGFSPERRAQYLSPRLGKIAGGWLRVAEAAGERLRGVLTLDGDLGLGGVALEVDELGLGLFDRLLNGGLGHGSPQILFCLGCGRNYCATWVISNGTGCWAACGCWSPE